MKSHQLQVYNTLTKQREPFEPLVPGKVGLYVCGPTVYNDVHLGNVRTFTSFDIIYRYLCYLGYKVRYVRNITDVGHLLDTGEDKMAKQARIEQLEPMEIAQHYTEGFHDIMRRFNAKSPSIEPRASGHIIEQIEMVQAILDNGLAYEMNGSVYFDTVAFHEKTGQYGKLSGRVLEDLMAASRDDLKNQDEKRHPADFAIWMKAQPEHIMRWNSPWSVGFPGWHLECSAMSTKYLGKHFDIHGGGNDLKFPHHENEVAQNMGACGCEPAKYWLHTNMLLMNGKKMSKSDGNTISPGELISGDSPHVSQGYPPAVVRFLILQTHYRSTMDISDDALQAALKGYQRVMAAIDRLDALSTVVGAGSEDESWQTTIHEAIHQMDQDFNTPMALAGLFDLVSKVNGFDPTKQSIGAEAYAKVKQDVYDLVFDIFGLERAVATTAGPMDEVMELLLDLRQQARTEKNWAMSDQIRDKLAAAGIEIHDGKDGSSWSLS